MKTKGINVSSRNRQLIINMAAQAISFAVSLGISFFLTPYIVENIGVEANGFVGLAKNFTGYVSIIIQTEGRIMHRNFEEKTFQTYAKIFENRMKFFKEEKDDELYGLSVFGFAGKIKADYIGLTYSDEDTIKMRKMLVKKYREIFKEVKKSRALSGNIKKYLEYRLFDISPLFYTKVILKLI